MNAHNLFGAGFLVAFTLLLNAHAQNPAPSGFYEISSGQYSECCGIGGSNDIALPNPDQRFVKFRIDEQSHIASMSILGEDMQTVFSIIPFCSPAQTQILFSFNGGLIFPDHVVFHVDPGPGGLYWNYTLSNSPSSFSISGEVGLQTDCVDVPNQFSHTSVVANFVTPPNVDLIGYSQDGVVIVVHGRAGWQTVVEVSSDLKTWVEIAHEVMPANQCVTCPQLVVTDTGADGMGVRFYRSYQRP